MISAIFRIMELFLRERLGYDDAWKRVLEHCGLEPIREMQHNDHDADILIDAAAELSRLSRSDLLFECGRFAAPYLLEQLKQRRPESVNWKTMDVAEHFEDLLRGVVKGGGSLPLEVRTLRLRFGESAMVLFRPKRLCPFVKGILVGVAKKVSQPLQIEEPVCQLQGAFFCRLNLMLNDPMLVRQIDVRREFDIALEKEEEIRFFNRFQGVPVVSTGEILRFDGQEAEFRLGHDQLVAMQLEEQTFFAIPHLTVGLAALVKSISVHEGVAVLHRMETTNGAVGQRASERVEPIAPIIVECMVEGRSLRGQMIDISVGGISIMVRQDVELTSNDLFSPIDLAFKLQSTVTRFRRGSDKTKHTIKWMDEEGASEPVLIQVAGNILDVVEDGDFRVVRIVFAGLPAEILGVLSGFVEQRVSMVFESLNKNFALDNG